MIEHYIILIDMLNETCVCRLLKAIQVWCLSTYSIEYRYCSRPTLLLNIIFLCISVDSFDLSSYTSFFKQTRMHLQVLKE